MIYGSFGIEPTDLRQVIGFGTNVFIGRVGSEVTHELRPAVEPDVPSIPMTVYSVVVEESVKGDLSGEVLVSQLGGYTEQGDLMMAQGDELLVSGSTYIMATHIDELGQYHLVAPGFDRALLGDPANDEDVLAEWRAAYENEVPYEQASP